MGLNAWQMALLLIGAWPLTIAANTVAGVVHVVRTLASTIK